MTKAEVEKKLDFEKFSLIGSYNGYKVYKYPFNGTGMSGWPLLALEKDGDYLLKRSLECVKIITRMTDKQPPYDKIKFNQ